MAEQSRAYVYDCRGATKTSLNSNLRATYVKERLSQSTKDTVTEYYGLCSEGPRLTRFLGLGKNRVT